MVVVALLVTLSVFSAGQVDRERTKFFEKKVRLLLVARCYECHSPDAKKVGGRLLLSSREGWEQGGERGLAIVAGEPERSLVIRAVRYEDKGDDLRQAGEEAAAIAEYERALTRFTDALACDVDHTRHYNIGNVYRKLQRFDEALAAYQEALRLHPSYARTHNNIGSIYFKNYKREK